MQRRSLPATGGTGTFSPLPACPALWRSSPTIRNVRIGATDTTWDIALQPIAGWPSAARETPSIWIAGLLVGLVTALASYTIDGQAVVEVSGNRAPMSTADMNRIFEPYTRSEAIMAASGSA